MNRFILPLLILTLNLGACAPSLPATDAIPPTTIPISSTTPSKTSLTPTNASPLVRLDQSIVDLPSIAAPSYKQCSAGPQRVFAIGYIVYDVIKKLDPIVDGFAETIDYECIDFNGNKFTYAVAIYFYIDNRFEEDLNDYETLGSWIVSVMNLLDTIPRDEYTRYAEPTNAIFTYHTSNSDTLKVIVPIQEYWAKANSNSGTEIFLMFYTEPQQNSTSTQSP